MYMSGVVKRLAKLRSDLPAIVDEFGMRLFEEMDYVNEGSKDRVVVKTVVKTVVKRERIWHASL